VFLKDVSCVLVHRIFLLTAKDLGFHGQPYPLFVSEPKPLSFELLLEYTILFDEIVDDLLLVPVEPAGQGDYQQMEGCMTLLIARTDYP
jgi:hypothetical protein